MREELGRSSVRKRGQQGPTSEWPDSADCGRRCKLEVLEYPGVHHRNSEQVKMDAFLSFQVMSYMQQGE